MNPLKRCKTIITIAKQSFGGMMQLISLWVEWLICVQNNTFDWWLVVFCVFPFLMSLIWSKYDQFAYTTSICSYISRIKCFFLDISRKIHILRINKCRRINKTLTQSVRGDERQWKKRQTKRNKESDYTRAAACFLLPIYGVREINSRVIMSTFNCR